MKRLGAYSRKRTKTTVVKNEHPSGPLTEDEIAAVRRAYSEGCRGELIIGMRGKERVITMMVPETGDGSPTEQMPRIREELRRLGCDGLARVRHW